MKKQALTRRDLTRRDIAKAKADPRGPDAYMAAQSGKSLKTAFANAEAQVINGTDAAGFNGLADSVFVDDVGEWAMNIEYRLTAV